MTLSTSSQIPKFLNLAKGEKFERQIDKLARTTVFRKSEYENQKSASPKEAPAARVSTEFKCRYQELTWKTRPAGMIPLQVKVGPSFDKKPTRAKVTKRSTEVNAHRALIKKQIDEAASRNMG